MLLRCYAIFDSKVEAYNTPFFQRTHGEAIRSFETAVSDPQSDFFKHSADFTLFHLGVFNDGSGTLEAEVIPVALSSGHEVLARLSNRS